MVAVKAPRQIYRSLLFAPAYVGSKLALDARAAVLPASQLWIGTERAGSNIDPMAGR